MTAPTASSISISDVLSRLSNAHQTGPNQFTARCPAHTDHNPSLSVGISADGHLLMYCHAGCSYEAIIASLEQGSGSRSIPNRVTDRARKPLTLEAAVQIYDYTDAAGTVLYKVARYIPKNFRPFQPDGRGGWKLGLDKAVPHVPYHLPRLRASAESDAAVLVVEGERDVARAEQEGFTATTTQGGANNWRANAMAMVTELKGRRVAIIPDADHTGEKYAADALKDIGAVAAKVAVLSLPRLTHRTAHGQDLSDWFNTYGGTAEELRMLVEVALAETRANTGDRAGEMWEEPMPLPDALSPVDLFDPALLPEPLRSWALDIADRMQVPIDFIAAGAVVVAAALVGRQIGIRPKRYDDWLVIPNIWGGIVGRPSLLKSPALAEVIKPLDRLAAQAAEQHEQAKIAYEIEKLVTEARKGALAEQMKKAAKDHDEATLARLKAEACTPLVAKPVQRRYKTNDPTVEKIGELLIENPNGLLLHRDELSGWLRSLNKQGREGDRQFYLESWNGIGTFDIDRIARGSLHVPALCISILGGIQPGPLSSYVYATQNGGEGDDGLLQRFQLLVWPDPPKTWVRVDRAPNATAKHRAYDMFMALAKLHPKAYGATVAEEGEVPSLHFSEAAQHIFDIWHERLEVRLRQGNLPPALEAHVAKFRSLMPSLALVFHLMHVVEPDHPDRQDTSGDILSNGVEGVSEEAAHQAAAWCEYLEPHARRLYGAAIDPEVERARALLAHLEAGSVADGTPLREVYRHSWEKLTTEQEVTAAAKVLETYGWVRIDSLMKPTGAGRPSTILHLHPRLCAEQSR